MIYITGDCHGNFERFNPSIFPEQNEMTKKITGLSVVTSAVCGTEMKKVKRRRWCWTGWIPDHLLRSLFAVITKILTAYISIRLRIGTEARFIR